RFLCLYIYISLSFFFVFTATVPTEIYTLSLHDALPISDLVIEQFGRDCFIYNEPTEEDIKCAREGLNKLREILKQGEYDLVVLDELNIALLYELFDIDEVIEIINNRASHVEVIITGRYAADKIIEIADLVTEMKEVKHYYTQGVEARSGIEK